MVRRMRKEGESGGRGWEERNGRAWEERGERMGEEDETG